MPSFCELGDKNKKNLADGEGKMFLPDSGISQNPDSLCFLALHAPSEL